MTDVTDDNCNVSKLGDPVRVKHGERVKATHEVVRATRNQSLERENKDIWSIFVFSGIFISLDVWRQVSSHSFTYFRRLTRNTKFHKLNHKEQNACLTCKIKGEGHSANSLESAYLAVCWS